MNESIEWFSTRVRTTMSQLPTSILDQLRNARVQVTIDGVCERHETLAAGIERRLQQLDEMAATCLLMLHLEVRVHLFHHLLPLARHSNHVVGVWKSQEADAQVYDGLNEICKFIARYLH
jgi:exocyst complex component 4